MLRIWRKYLTPYWWQVLILVVFQVAQTILNLYLPNLQADIINKGVATADTSKVYHIGWAMVGVAIVQIIANIIASYLSTRLGMRLGYEARRDFFSSVEDFSLNELEKFSVGSLITRSTNDVQQVQQATMMALMIILQAPIMLIGGIIMAIQQNASLTRSIVIVIPVVLIVAGILLSQMGPLFKRLQKGLDTLNRLIREQVAGVRVIRAFVREKTEAGRFQKANKDVYDILIPVGRLMSTMIPIMFFIVNLSNVAIMWFGGKLIESGDMQIGSLQAFIQYLMVIFIGVMMAAMMSVMLPRASVAAGRIDEVLEARSSVQAPEHPYWPARPKGLIKFKDVSFRYAGAKDPVLSHISFTAEPGRTTAIIGSTGSDKSTIVRLVSRMFDVTEGQILIDGHDVREYDPARLNTLFGTVPQKALLFSGTVRSNMLFGDPQATDEQIWEALRIAQAGDFIAEEPGKLDAPVAEGGTNFSGGQKQRLCIARAILRNPKIYTFDDSFSALDVATDRRVRDALAPVTRQATQIIVTQRASSIRQADQILVMDDGRIVGRGSHDELMRTCTAYQEIVESQGGQGPDVESLALDGIPTSDKKED